MALSTSFEATAVEESPSSTGIPLLPITTTGQENYEFTQGQRLNPDSSIDTRGRFFPENGEPQLKQVINRIESLGFSFNYPWLPLSVKKLLNKAKKGSLTENEMVTLMEQISERAFAHFRLPAGIFVAMTFQGRVVEASDTRISLLKKLQGREYKEQIFVWRIGFEAFSGRI